MKVVHYTDGSCNVRSQKGGYGVYTEVYNNDNPDIFHVESHFRGFNGTKTGRMELGGILYALTKSMEYPPRTKVTIICDSQYAVNTMDLGWAEGWRIKHWVGVKNVDLVEAMLTIKEYLRDDLRIFVDFKWVKGHAGNEGNEHADELAKMGYKTDPDKSTDDYGDFSKW